MEAGDEAAARLAFRGIREESPGEWPAYWEEIRLTSTKEGREEIRRALESRVEGDPTDAGRAAAMALLSEVVMDPADADSLLIRALEESPRSGLARAIDAQRLQNRGEKAKAYESWKQAVRGEWVPDWAWPMLAQNALDAHDDALAKRAIEQCLELFPEQSKWPYDLGTIALAENDASRAYEYLGRAHELAPADLDVLLNFSTAAVRNGRIELAGELLEDALALYPEDPQVHFNLGVFHADETRNVDAALRHFRRYLELTGEPSLRIERWIKELEARKR